jgi:HK97 family phage portal protein
MSALSRVLKRNIENPAVPLTSSSLLEVMGGVPSTAGVTVTEQTAMRQIAVFRCAELIAGTCAALPIKAYRKGSRERLASYTVLDDPHPELTRFEVWETLYLHLLLWGNCYARKLRDGAGRIQYLWPIHPSRVHVDLINPSATNPGGKVFAIDNQQGGQDPYTSYEILHIPGMGYDGRVGLSRIQLAKQALGVGMAAEEYAAKFYASGSMFSGILTAETSLNQTQADTLKSRWKEKVGGLRNAHDIAVLDNGAKFQPISIPPEDAQLLESRQWSVTEIARLFGLPPHAIGDVEKSTSWGSGIEQQTIGMVQFTLQPSYLTRVEQRLTKEVLLAKDVYAEYDVNGLLRGDTATRYEAHAKARQWGLQTLNQYNALENKPLVDGALGDSYLVPAGYTLIAADGTVMVNAKGTDPTAPVDPVVADDTKARAVQHLRLLATS